MSRLHGPRPSASAAPPALPARAPEEYVVLVDSRDRALGTAEKLRAHRQALLHRAFSVFLFDGAGRLLLQQRALTKYHSPGRWSNACCGHPRPGEETAAAARRRLGEELGVDCALEHRVAFLYRADVGDDLVEHELDHLFVGRTDAPLAPDPGEVQAWRWVELGALLRDVRARPEDFTLWLAPALERLLGVGG